MSETGTGIFDALSHRDANRDDAYHDLDQVFSIDTDAFNPRRLRVAGCYTALHFFRCLGGAFAKPAGSALQHYRDAVVPALGAGQDSNADVSDSCTPAATPRPSESDDDDAESDGAHSAQDAPPRAEIGSVAELWDVCLGRPLATPAAARFLRRDFDEAVTCREDVRRWLIQYLSHDAVRFGLGAASMQGLIRVASGFHSDCDDDIVMGVALLVTHAIPPPPLPDRAPGSHGGEVDVLPSLKAAWSNKALAKSAPSKLLKADDVASLDDRVSSYFNEPALRDVLPRLSGNQPDRCLFTILTAALVAFEDYHDFSAPHLLTGTCALHTLVDELRADASAKLLGDLLTGFWAYALAVGLALPYIKHSKKKTRRSSKDVCNLPAAEEFDPPLHGLLHASYCALHVAATNGPRVKPHRFEGLCQLAFGCMCVVKRARDAARVQPDVPEYVEWANELEARCARLVRREAEQLAQRMRARSRCG